MRDAQLMCAERDSVMLSNMHVSLHAQVHWSHVAYCISHVFALLQDCAVTNLCLCISRSLLLGVFAFKCPVAQGFMQGK